MAIAIPGSEEEYAALSWLDIAKLSDQCAAGDGSDYTGLLGYKKPIEVSGVGTVQVKVIGLNHDTYVDGGTAGFTFQLTDGLSTSKPVNMQMNASDIVTGGWRDSVMRKTNIPALLAALPSDLSSLIKKVTKKSSTSQTGTDVVETEDDLFLLSLIESIGTTKTAYTDNPIPKNSPCYMENEGSQYEYYKQFDSSNTEAFNHHIIKADTGSAELWWLRSIRWNQSNRFYNMYTSGDWYSSFSVASFSCLPAAGFCIAPPPPHVKYLAGDWKGKDNDQPQTLQWVDADSEHRFYDETGQWSKIEQEEEGGPLVVPILKYGGGTGYSSFATNSTFNMNYSDIDRQLVMFVDVNGTSVSTGGSSNFEFSDGKHSVTIEEPSSTHTSDFIECILPFVFNDNGSLVTSYTRCNNGGAVL